MRIKKRAEKKEEHEVHKFKIFGLKAKKRKQTGKEKELQKVINNLKP